MSQEEKIAKFREYIATIRADAPPEEKVLIFQTIHALWEEVGQLPDVVNTVCQALKMSPEFFSVCVDNPELANTTEVLSHHLKGGWLHDYLQYTASEEGPEEFHLWIGLTILSAALRRRAYITSGKHRIFPNLFTVLVSPPSVCRKSSSASIGMDLLEDSSPCKIYSGKITPEQLIHSLYHLNPVEHGHGSQCLLFTSEMGNMFGEEKYMQPLPILLTDLYDCPDRWAYETRKGGTTPLQEVFISMLACTTPENLPKILSKSTNEGGLLSRLILIYKTQTPRCFPVPRPMTVREKELRGHLVDRLKILSGMEPIEFTLRPDAEEWYAAWYRGWKSALEQGQTQHFASRMNTLVLKIAMLLTISERGEVSISADTLKRAFRLITEVVEGTRQLLDLVGTGPLNGKPDVANLILRFVDRAGGTISRQKLLRCMIQNHVFAREMNPSIEQLKGAGLLQEFQSGEDDKVKFYMKVREKSA